MNEVGKLFHKMIMRKVVKNIKIMILVYLWGPYKFKML